MVSNAVNIGSANIVSLGFLAFFNLDTKQLLIDIDGQTIFTTGGASHVVGICFKVEGPGGLILADVDFTSPHINPSSGHSYAINLPNGYGMFGFYSIQAFIKDQDAKIYQTAKISKDISKPEGFDNGYAKGNVIIEPDCDIPQLLITDHTNTSYRGLSPASKTTAGKLSYPAGTLSDLAFTYTPFLVAGAGLVYTGRYTVNNKTLCTYELPDGFRVIIPYVVKGYEKVVDVNTGLSELLCCVEEIHQQYKRDPFSTSGKSALKKLQDVSVPFYKVILKEKSGQDASADIAIIKKELNCDCCSSVAIEPKPILGVGLTGVIIAMDGQNAAQVSNTTSGSTKTFHVNVKNVNVEKDEEELGFSIVRSEDANNINFAIEFNYPSLAANILNAIKEDENLTELLRELINISNTGISLDGINNSCVITINNCDYDLIESTIPVKVLTSITIGGNVYNAPNGLQITNTAGVASWLNGLGKGSFVVTIDNDSNTVHIRSAANSNVISILALTSGSVAVTRQFTRTCIGLVQILNAITTYICAIDTTRVTYGLIDTEINNLDGSTVELSSAAKLSVVIAAMLTAHNALVASVTTVALTCTNLKTIFTPNDNAFGVNDGIYGLRGGTCARIPVSDLALAVLTAISGDSSLKSQLCTLASSCAPSVCGVVTALSAVFSGGNLTINANNIDPSTSLQIRYRIADSGLTYTQATKASGDFPVVIMGLTTARYEVGVRKLCTNGTYSDWVIAFTSGCAVPVGFTAAKSHLIGVNQFNCTASLTGSQTKVDVQITDPNGGVTINTYDLGGQTGSFTIPISEPTLYGTYQLRARAVCDNNAPRYVSEFLAPIFVNNASPTPGDSNFTGSIGNGMTIVSITNGTASGVPASFTGSPYTGSRSDYTPQLTVGTIIVVLSGTPTLPDIQLNLVKGVGTILDSVNITGAGSYTLTNPAIINFPETITVTNLNLA